MATTSVQLAAGGAAALASPRVILPVMGGLVYAGLFDGGNVDHSRLNRAPGGGRCAAPFGTLPTIDGPWTVFQGGAAGFDTGVPDLAACNFYAVMKTTAPLTGAHTPMIASSFGADGKGTFFSLAADQGTSASVLAVSASSAGSTAQPIAAAAVPYDSYRTAKLVSGVVGAGTLQARDRRSPGGVDGTVTSFSGGRALVSRNLLIGTAHPGAPNDGAVHLMLALVYNTVLSEADDAAVVAWCRGYAASNGLAV
ncbi:hypothetical protein M0638_24940 [Roseomonas sp. NAR14]|uniref:Uncharacterized protein n=1 Tax=Roseomonas acroporae TaxID=2937791 RepID=A0A9X2BWF1_9PROT|nr:hypothetical protein [Roseomonas acroporae]MCK8787617.1 hypothetical protein [Roseomonas acroporae]